MHEPAPKKGNEQVELSWVKKTCAIKLDFVSVNWIHALDCVNED